MAHTTITFRTDRGVVAYSALERPHADEPGVVAGSLPKRVRVAEPNLDYVFTDSRDVLADVAAAMLVAGNGRGRLSDAGWNALDAAMADDAGPDTDSPVIH